MLVSRDVQERGAAGGARTSSVSASCVPRTVSSTASRWSRSATLPIGSAGAFGSFSPSAGEGAAGGSGEADRAMLSSSFLSDCCQPSRASFLGRATLTSSPRSPCCRPFSSSIMRAVLRASSSSFALGSSAVSAVVSDAWPRNCSSSSISYRSRRRRARGCSTVGDACAPSSTGNDADGSVGSERGVIVGYRV